MLTKKERLKLDRDRKPDSEPAGIKDMGGKPASALSLTSARDSPSRK